MTGLDTYAAVARAAETDWAALETQLDIWRSAGRTATFWWRDDDAVAVTPALERQLALAGETPIALAVIPVRAERGLADRLRRTETVTVLQHGWGHTNHAPAGEGKSELGDHRPPSQRLDELRLGRERLEALFGPLALRVLVPPWNRIAGHLVPRLPEIGIHGLSTQGARRTAEPAAAVRQVNVHADLIDWDGSREFVGEEAALGLVLRHLRNRLLARGDADEPTGILTHHLVQEAATEGFLRRLIATVGRHAAARFVPIPELFPAP